MMVKRRDLLRTLGTVGAVTAVGRLLDPVAAGGQSFPAVSGHSTPDNFTTGQGFVTFLNRGPDGRMQHLASRRRLHAKRVRAALDEPE
jgi:hypothetical protein